MHALDKTVLTTSAQTEPGHAFIKHVGAVEKHCRVEQRAVFADLDWPHLRQWEDGATAQGLTWERYAGRVPRDVLVALLPVFTELLADVPLGELETGPIRWEMNGYDLWYQTLERVGGAHHLVLLRAPDGGVIGLSEAAWDVRAPGIVRQQLTAVARPWRSRGVGRALKAAMLRQVHELHPEATIIGTNNAEVNAPILSINARVGFKIALAQRGLSGDSGGVGFMGGWLCTSNEYHVESVEIGTQSALSWRMTQMQWNGRVRKTAPAAVVRFG